MIPQLSYKMYPGIKMADFPSLDGSIGLGLFENNDNTKYEMKTGKLGHYVVNGNVTDQNVVKVSDLTDGMVNRQSSFHVLLLNKNGEVIGYAVMNKEQYYEYQNMIQNYKDENEDDENNEEKNSGNN